MVSQQGGGGVMSQALLREENSGCNNEENCRVVKVELGNQVGGSCTSMCLG